MRKSVKFIHAADLHLGAPFRGLAQVSEQWARRLSTAIREAYARIVEEAISRKVHFVVIAGDIFDTSRASFGDYLYFFDGLRKLQRAGIEVYMVCGNHDPYTSWKESAFLLPENAHMFPASKPGFKLFEHEGEPLCIIGGRSYYNQTWPQGVSIAQGISREEGAQALSSECPQAKSAPFCVGVIHTGLHLDPIKAPENPNALLQKNVDYWACGHIHKSYVHHDDAGCARIVFPGCIQGRDIKEVGQRGVCCVEISEGSHVELEFIPTASVVWQQLSVDVSDCAGTSDITDLITRQLFIKNGEAHCEEMVSRVTLVGKTPLHNALSRPGAMEDLRAHLNNSCPQFFCDTLINETREVRDKQKLAAEGLFPSVLLQISNHQNANVEATKDFLEQEFMQRNIALPKNIVESIDSLQEEAEELALDLLQQGVK